MNYTSDNINNNQIKSNNINIKGLHEPEDLEVKGILKPQKVNNDINHKNNNAKDNNTSSSEVMNKNHVEIKEKEEKEKEKDSKIDDQIESEKDKFFNNNIDLKKKKELLEKKLNDQKLQKRYEEIPFPNISNRVKQLDEHFRGKPATEDKYNTNKSNKSEAEEIGDRILAEKPVFKKKMKSKPAEFQE